MPKVELNFEQGLAFALGELIRSYDEPSIATYILKSSGITYEQLREKNVSDYDLKVIKKALKGASNDPR